MKLLQTFFFLCFGISSVCQETSFRLDGVITGTTNGIVIVIYSKSDPNIALSQDTFPVKNSSFQITGRVAHPYQVQIKYKDSKIERTSKSFLIDKGIQHLVSNIQSDTFSYKRPYVFGLPIHAEYNLIFSRQRDTAVRIYDSLISRLQSDINLKERSLIDKSIREVEQLYDSLLSVYIRNDPASYVGLWALFDYSKGKGYSRYLDSAYSHMAEFLQLTAPGKDIGERITRGRQLQNFNNWNQSKFLYLKDGSFETNLSVKLNATYTLIEFWFTRCAPCIKQFPELRKLYADYHGLDFDLISISVDKKKERNNLIKMINNSKLTWRQYWDVDGSTLTNVNVTSFPANILVDDKGNIIRYNISFLELKDLIVHLKD